MSNRTYALSIIFGVALGLTLGALAWAGISEIAASQVALNQ